MFGTSGMRGTVGEDVTCDRVLAVGRALAAEGYGRVVVGRDARESGEMLADVLSSGLREGGADVVRLGVAATPTVARSVEWVDADAGVSVTASHNPAADNGLKLWTESGRAFDADRQAAVADRVRHEAYDLADWQTLGSETRRPGTADRHAREVAAAVEDVTDLSVVVDVGNGTGSVAADALRSVGCSVNTLDARPDGSFPARPSEPTADNCETLADAVAATDADLGVALDGDSDRMMAVTDDGSFLPGDVLLAVFATEVADAGDAVAAPVNVSLVVADALADVGADLVRTRVGDGFVAARSAEPDVVFGGETSGTWIWPSETLCPDGPLAACRLAALVDRRGPLRELAGRVPDSSLRRENVRVDDKDAVMDRVTDRIHAENDGVDDRDGVRVDADDGWFLVRASGTQPLIRLTAEARSEERCDELLDRARNYVSRVAATAD